jgi:hypothetical protein
LKPDLPDKYQVVEWDGKWLLIENTPTFKPVHNTNGTTKVQEADQREVASFPKNSRVREVERVALRDFMSRRPKLDEEEKRARMRALVETFGRSVAAVGPGERSETG